jgi:hypothetical protein
MKYENYHVESDRRLLLYRFISIGPKGEIIKLIQYTELNLRNYFNLGFGDVDEKTGEINDTIITNNGDSRKVLATVANTLYLFTKKYPKAHIQIKGSRTRLYRIGISNNLIKINEDFHVFGHKNSKWHEFEVGIEYEEFLILRKK